MKKQERDWRVASGEWQVARGLGVLKVQCSDPDWLTPFLSGYLGRVDSLIGFWA